MGPGEGHTVGSAGLHGPHWAHSRTQCLQTDTVRSASTAPASRRQWVHWWGRAPPGWAGRAMCHVPRGKLRAHPGDCLGQHVAQSEGAPGGRDCPGRGALSPDGARGALGSQGDAVSQPGSLGRPTLRLPRPWGTGRVLWSAFRCGEGLAPVPAPRQPPAAFLRTPSRTAEQLSVHFDGNFVVRVYRKMVFGSWHH